MNRSAFRSAMFFLGLGFLGGGERSVAEERNPPADESSSRPAGPSSRPAGPSSRPAGPSSRPAGPSSRPAGPSSRPGDPGTRTELDDPTYYTCPMHPSVRQKSPGKCPLCAMDLTPVTAGGHENGVLVVDDDMRQKIGVRIGTATKRPLVKTIRAAGMISYDEARLRDVNLRMTGWIEKLIVTDTEQRVKRGQVLFYLYSPELYGAQGGISECVQSLRCTLRGGRGSDISVAFISCFVQTEAPLAGVGRP